MPAEHNKVISPNSVATQSFTWGIIKWSVTPTNTPGAKLTFGEVILLPGQGHDRHNHPESEEVLYVLSGQGMQTIADEEAFAIRAGDTIHIPASVFHSTQNVGWAPLRLLAIYNPGGPDKDLEGLPDFTELSPEDTVHWSRTE